MANETRLTIKTSSGKEMTLENVDLSNSGRYLTGIVNRIESLESDKQELTKDINEIYKEAKDTGYNVKVLRNLIRIRKMDEHERREQAQLLLLYRQEVGMSTDLPLFESAKDEKTQPEEKGE